MITSRIEELTAENRRLAGQVEQQQQVIHRQNTRIRMLEDESRNLQQIAAMFEAGAAFPERGEPCTDVCGGNLG